MYIAQTVKTAKTKEVLDNLIIQGLLPREARIDNETLNNILNGYYMLTPRGIDSKEDITVRALMKLPMDTLEQYAHLYLSFGMTESDIFSSSTNVAILLRHSLFVIPIFLLLASFFAVQPLFLKLRNRFSILIF
jgi:hypothetical protein